MIPGVADAAEGDGQLRRRAAMLLIVTGGGVLMHHRDDKPGIAHPGCWAGFGGAVEDGETVGEALRREVKEETGLVIADPVFLTDAVDHEGDGKLVSLFYIVGDYRPEDIDLREGAGAGLQRITDLPGLKVTPFVRRAIESHLLPVISRVLARDQAEQIDSTIVRDARAADAAQIALVHVRSWQGAYRGLMPQAYLDGLDLAQRAARWERSLAELNQAHAGVLVAEGDGHLLGFIGYSASRDDDADPARVGEVQAIYLLPHAWGKGVGVRLMEAALRRLTEAGFAEATLWVLGSNARARRFYEAGGWSADGTVQSDESRGFPITEIRYRRRLPGSA